MPIVLEESRRAGDGAAKAQVGAVMPTDSKPANLGSNSPASSSLQPWPPSTVTSGAHYYGQEVESWRDSALSALASRDATIAALTKERDESILRADKAEEDEIEARKALAESRRLHTEAENAHDKQFAAMKKERDEARLRAKNACDATFELSRIVNFERDRADALEAENARLRSNSPEKPDGSSAASLSLELAALTTNVERLCRHVGIPFASLADAMSWGAKFEAMALCRICNGTRDTPLGVNSVALDREGHSVEVRCNAEFHTPRSPAGETKTDAGSVPSDSGSERGNDNARGSGSRPSSDHADRETSTPHAPKEQPASTPQPAARWIAVIALIEKAEQHVYDICEGRKRWRMSIPVQADDSDMTIATALQAAKKALAASPRTVSAADVERFFRAYQTAVDEREAHPSRAGFEALGFEITP